MTAGEAITGLILSGGMGRRMGGIDKGLIPLHGRPMVAHVMERLRPQVDTVMISANRELDTYRTLGCQVITDATSDYAGPLAGLHSGMLAAATPLIATAPCDAPLLPVDLVTRLLSALQAHDADLATARTGDRLQPVFSLCRTTLLPQLADFMAKGGRKVEAWHAGLSVVTVDFGDEAAAFANINTMEDLALQEQPS